ncbi:Hypothetical protein EHI5A_102530 [Entamoeba histolytica KU27]|uniref:Uncharacterized protein n=1 Tax=Entamoeba histolytica KU27 TaxID=885311 RepID=M2S4X3_ENTHI|nr:Hypothetical protein EHI5A_102530 [Entamoeba histolytica KU27]
MSTNKTNIPHKIDQWFKKTTKQKYVEQLRKSITERNIHTDIYFLYHLIQQIYHFQIVLTDINAQKDKIHIMYPVSSVYFIGDIKTPLNISIYKQLTTNLISLTRLKGYRYSLESTFKYLCQFLTNVGILIRYTYPEGILSINFNFRVYTQQNTFISELKSKNDLMLFVHNPAITIFNHLKTQFNSNNHLLVLQNPLFVNIMFSGNDTGIVAFLNDSSLLSSEKSLPKVNQLDTFNFSIDNLVALNVNNTDQDTNINQHDVQLEEFSFTNFQHTLLLDSN